MNFETFCTGVFERMEKNLVERNELLFWSAGRAVPTLSVREKMPGNGTWFATASIAEGQVAGISLMLVHGELRVGSIIPKLVIDHHEDDALVILSPDGNPPDAVRELEDAFLYDRSYQDEPFTARWIIEAYDDERKAEAVALTMAALVSSTWKAAYNLISRFSLSGLDHTVMLLSDSPLPTERLKSEMVLAISEVGFFKGLGYTARARSACPADELHALIVQAGITGVHVSTHEEIETAVA